MKKGRRTVGLSHPLLPSGKGAGVTERQAGISGKGRIWAHFKILVLVHFCASFLLFMVVYTCSAF